MNARTSCRRARGTAALLCGVLAAACAPDRVPGSTVSQGDAGIAFHRELAALRGAGSFSGGRGGTSTSGASYGGGSSSSARDSGVLALEALDLRPGGRACDWVAAADATVGQESAQPSTERARTIATEAWVVANCTTTGELR
ncbi:MAG: hypothetical protein HY944_00685 [Gemmatimonadetes bacterium]|nr:hypothetical protein [Gemmatimonadota bacterium]